MCSNFHRMHLTNEKTTLSHEIFWSCYYSSCLKHCDSTKIIFVFWNITLCISPLVLAHENLWAPVCFRMMRVGIRWEVTRAMTLCFSVWSTIDRNSKRNHNRSTNFPIMLIYQIDRAFEIFPKQIKWKTQCTSL